MLFSAKILITSLVLITILRVILRMHFSSKEFKSQVFHGSHYTKMAVFRCSPGIILCLGIWWNSRLGVLVIPQAILGLLFLVLLHRMLQPFICIHDDLMTVRIDPMRRNQLIEIGRLISVEICALKTGEHNISFKRLDETPLTYTTQYREPEFLKHIENFARTNGIAIHRKS